VAAQLHAGAPAAVSLVSFERTDAMLAIVVPLAAALATYFGPTLVVDCDLGEPTLGERFAVPAGRGLIDLLPGPARWQEVVRPTQLNGVDLLPGRRLVAADGHPPERLDLGPLVQEWLARYRLVLLAAGPLGNPEVGSLLRSSHAAMLVVELGRTTQRSARKAVRAVRSAGAHLLGSIAVEAA
jgi:Mrp family chromosome partitioning ATPase